MTTREAAPICVDCLLRDGQSAQVRAALPSDADGLRRHFESLGPDSLYLRFMSAGRHSAELEAAHLASMDPGTESALVLVRRGAKGEEIILGVGSYCLLPPTAGSTRRAEVAFSVADAAQGHGVGTLLLEQLAESARARGVEGFEAEVLSGNHRMIRMFEDAGFEIRQDRESGQVHVALDTRATERFAQAKLGREMQAAGHSMYPLLNPCSVAVVGASRKPGTIGAALVENVKNCGFRGPVYPVNPAAGEVAGLKCYPSVGAVGQPVDLALICTPAAAVEAAVADCARAGVRGVVVISSGFRESSSQGAEVERRLHELARSSGMRLVGPNCMGLLNTDPAVQLNAMFTPMHPEPGTIGFLSQSGALGVAILDCIRARGIGLSTFVSVGNKADVSGNDMLSYWADDPNTRLVLLYLESFGNPRKFARLAPLVARRKPIVAVKSGRSAAGTRAAASHSASLANLDVAVDALFEQAGVIRTSTMEELMDVSALLATQPPPRGPRVGVVTNAGGPGILLADACEARGLRLPILAADTLGALRSFLPPQAGFSNPIDLIASGTPEQYRRAVELVGQDPSVDSVVVLYIPPMVTSPQEVMRAVAEAAGRVPAEKPVLVVFTASAEVPRELWSGPRGRIPSVTFPENAALALAAAERYARWRARPRGDVRTMPEPARRAVRACVDAALAGAAGPRWMSPGDVARLLQLAGIQFAATRCAAPDAVAALADELGYPLVAKAVAPGLVHKSDAQGVILGIRSAREVEQAARQLAANIRLHGHELESVMLQREVQGGIEALVGVTTDPTFGPLVVCGMGGVLVELLRDVAFRLTPVSDLDAEAMLSQLRSGRLLDGYRGSPPGDRAALVDLVQRVSALVEAVPELRELDLNPVKVLEPGRGAIAVDGRIRIAPL